MICVINDKQIRYISSLQKELMSNKSFRETNLIDVWSFLKPNWETYVMVTPMADDFSFYWKKDEKKQLVDKTIEDLPEWRVIANYYFICIHLDKDGTSRLKSVEKQRKGNDPIKLQILS